MSICIKWSKVAYSSAANSWAQGHRLTRSNWRCRWGCRASILDVRTPWSMSHEESLLQPGGPWTDFWSQETRTGALLWRARKAFCLSEPGKYRTPWPEMCLMYLNNILHISNVTTCVTTYPRYPEVTRSGRIVGRGVKKIQVLDTQRRRQVCVMLARLPTNLKEVPRALQLLDSDTLDSEQVQTETDGNRWKLKNPDGLSL